MTTVLAVVSDTHCGGTTGLCPPIYELYDRGHQRATEVQRWLWRCWVDYWRRVDALAEKFKADIWVVLNGDLVEGWHHNTTQIVSLRPDDMKNIAVTSLEPYVRKASRVFVTKGTEAHVGAGGLWDDIIAEDLGAIRGPGSPAWYWLQMNVEGARFAFAHHGKGGGREHTRGGGARALASDLSAYYWRNYRGNPPPPEYAVFGHIHGFSDSGIADFDVRVLTSGCWQLSTGHGSRIRPGRQPEIGGLVFVCRDGQVVNGDPVLRYVPEAEKDWRNDDYHDVWGN